MSGYGGGRVEIGYDLDADGVRLIENAQEQAVIADIIELRDSGLSYRVIADELAARGATTRAGRPWSAKVLRSLVLRHGEAA